ncbi:MAG TPA: hypothetical protein VMI35_01460 [Puia sp.]|nr:hypothetical protein [Puia sp.]
MSSIDLSMNALTLIVIVLFSGLIGYVLKNRQLKKKQLKIQELRKEMVSNHAHILELQKEYVTLEMQLRGIKSTTPVLPLKPALREDEKRMAEGM